MASNRSTWNRGKGFKEDSKFESELRYGIFKDLEYHPEKIAYTISHKYEPDWVIKDECGHCFILIEAKGALRESHEIQKYLNLKKQLPDNVELVFLFQFPNSNIPCRPAKRKDGSRLTHREWAEINKFRWFDINTIKEIL